jgi:hypothetical protein
MYKLVLRFLVVSLFISTVFYKPNNTHAAVNAFPLDRMVNLLDVKFAGKTLKQIYQRNPGIARYGIQCLTSRIVTNFPPKVFQPTAILGQVVWFDALYFVSEVVSSGRPIFVRNDVVCVYTTSINTIQNWMSNFRHLSKPPYNSTDWYENPVGFVYYLNFYDPGAVFERWTGSNWCRARSVGNDTTGKIYYNAVFSVNDINSYYITYTSIDIICTYDRRVVSIWLRNGWVRYKYS